MALVSRGRRFGCLRRGGWGKDLGILLVGRLLLLTSLRVSREGPKGTKERSEKRGRWSTCGPRRMVEPGGESQNQGKPPRPVGTSGRLGIPRGLERTCGVICRCYVCYENIESHRYWVCVPRRIFQKKIWRFVPLPFLFSSIPPSFWVGW